MIAKAISEVRRLFGKSVSNGAERQYNQMFEGLDCHVLLHDEKILGELTDHFRQSIIVESSVRLRSGRAGRKPPR